MMFYIGIPLLAVVSVGIALGRALTKRRPRTLCEIIPLIQVVDLADLRNLLDPALDTYLTKFLPASGSVDAGDVRTAQKNRIIFTRQHFQRLLHNSLLFRSFARAEYRKLIRKPSHERSDVDHIVHEVAILAVHIIRSLRIAQLKLALMQVARCYACYRLLEGGFILQQYCRLTERVLVLCRNCGEDSYYENLLAALSDAAPDPEFVE